MLPITALYTGLTGLAFAALSLYVSLRRKDLKLSKGDGGDRDTQTRIRQHANFIEYAPITLLLIAMAEAQGAPALVLHSAGIALLATRLGHFIGYGHPRGYRVRLASMTVCYLLLFALGLGLTGHALL